MANKKVLLGISVPVLCIGVGLGGYFIGYNVGYNTMKEDLKRMDGGIAAAYVETAPTILEGTYKRSFYNDHNKSVESYMVFRNDGTCKYVEQWSTSATVNLDLNTMDDDCSYTYDKDSYSGEITYAKAYAYYDNNQTLRYNPKVLKYTLNYNTLTIGAAAYYKVQN